MTAQPRPTVVLLAEDESHQRSLAAALQAAETGLHIVEATDSAEALTLLDECPDVRALLADVAGPGPTDGWALARIVDMRWPGVAILVASAQAPRRGDLPSKAHFLLKPYDAGALLALVREALGKPQAIVLPAAPPSAWPSGSITSRAGDGRSHDPLARVPSHRDE